MCRMDHAQLPQSASAAETMYITIQCHVPPYSMPMRTLMPATNEEIVYVHKDSFALHNEYFTDLHMYCKGARVQYSGQVTQVSNRSFVKLDNFQDMHMYCTLKMAMY